MTVIHPTAVVDPAAELGRVTVGPYAVIGPGVRLADGVSVGAHAVISGRTRVGIDTRIGPHAVIGEAPQDLEHDARVPTELLIGARNVFREFTTVHHGSSNGSGVTSIGDDNLFMVGSHVGHDCIVGHRCQLSNGVALGGHVDLADDAVIGGLAAVHQRVRIGRLVMIGGGAMVTQDVPPFALAQGDRARLYGLNVVGLRRAAFGRTIRNDLQQAWRTLFVSGLPRQDAIRKVNRELGRTAEVLELTGFLVGSVRGVCRAPASVQQ